MLILKTIDTLLLCNCKFTRNFAFFFHQSMPAYTMPSYELPHIGSSSHQLVPRRPDRPKSNYGHRTSSPSRPRSALMGRPKSAGGRLKTKPEPSSTRYGYDSYGQRVRIRKEVCIYRVDDTFQVLA